MVDFIAHDRKDTVAVVVVEGVKAKQKLTGWLMEGDETLQMTVLDDIPIGHKLALQDIAKGDTILKYGHDIGSAVSDISAGGHVHVQNVKTKRW